MKLRIRMEGKTYELEVEVVEEDRPSRSRHHPRHSATPVTLPPVASAEMGGADPAEEARFCRSPVTGVVKAIHVEAGQQVQAGQPIMVLEAMKMETEITAPVAGKVKSVNVAKGDSVQAREIVAEFG